MALHEGSRRMRKVGKGFMLFGLGIGLLGTIFLCFGSGFQLFNIGQLIPLLLMPVFLAEVVGIALWVVAWVVEGFALPSSPESDRIQGD